MRSVLARLAAGAPARVFPLVGLNAPGEVEELRLCDDLLFVDSPRSANILLVAGSLPESLHEPALHIHDQMSRPRRTLWWARGPETVAGRAPFPEATSVRAHEDLIAELQLAQRELLTGLKTPDEAALLPDIAPAPWRGVGPYGQGGTGMTGGVPYGRPLTGRAADRDGMELDQLTVRVGPFFPPFPTGLVLEVKLQGDVVQDVTVGTNPFVVPDDGAPPATAHDDPERIFRVALTNPVPVAELELARARHHLRWLAHALRVQGLPALGLRALAAARSASPALLGETIALGRFLERTRLFAWATSNVGVLESDEVACRGLGPVARAAGLPEDARGGDPAYRALGFEPIVHRGSDARARWRQRLAEALQSLGLAARAGNRMTDGAGRVEGPRGLLASEAAPDATLLALVPKLLRGADWSDAVTTVVSLDLDLRAAAAGPAARAASTRVAREADR